MRNKWLEGKGQPQISPELPLFWIKESIFPCNRISVSLRLISNVISCFNLSLNDCRFWGIMIMGCWKVAKLDRPRLSKIKGKGTNPLSLESQYTLIVIQPAIKAMKIQMNDEDPPNAAVLSETRWPNVSPSRKISFPLTIKLFHQITTGYSLLRGVMKTMAADLSGFNKM